MIIDSNSIPVYESEIVKLLVNEFMDEYFQILLKKMFVPFVAHVFFVTAHLLVVL